MESSVGGTVLGAVFGELLKAVLDAKHKAMVFKETMDNLEATLKSIDPVIKKIEHHNNKLGRPKEELESLKTKMENGTRLVRECSEIGKLDFVNKIRYQGKLEALGDSLMRFFVVDLQVQMARDQMETLRKVRKMEIAVKKLPSNYAVGESYNNPEPAEINVESDYDCDDDAVIVDSVHIHENECIHDSNEQRIKTEGMDSSFTRAIMARGGLKDIDFDLARCTRSDKQSAMVTVLGTSTNPSRRVAPNENTPLELKSKKDKHNKHHHKRSSEGGSRGCHGKRHCSALAELPPFPRSGSQAFSANNFFVENFDPRMMVTPTMISSTGHEMMEIVDHATNWTRFWDFHARVTALAQHLTLNPSSELKEVQNDLQISREALKKTENKVLTLSTENLKLQALLKAYEEKVKTLEGSISKLTSISTASKAKILKLKAALEASKKAEHDLDVLYEELRVGALDKIFAEHVNGFNHAIRLAIFSHGVPKDAHFNMDTDVYNGELKSLDEIATARVVERDPLPTPKAKANEDFCDEDFSNEEVDDGDIECK